jgi:hypothetical protein
MCPSTTPEYESRGLINCMQKPDTHDEEMFCNFADETITGIRRKMLSESAKQTCYIDIIGDLLDDSVEYNNLMQVVLTIGPIFCILPKAIICMCTGEPVH